MGLSLSLNFHQRSDVSQKVMKNLNHTEILIFFFSVDGLFFHEGLDGTQNLTKSSFFVVSKMSGLSSVEDGLTVSEIDQRTQVGVVDG